MKKNTSLLPAAGCLGSIPNRAGKTFLGNKALLQQIEERQPLLMFDKTSSGLPPGLFQFHIGEVEHKVIIGPTRTGMSKL